MNSYKRISLSIVFFVVSNLGFSQNLKLCPQAESKDAQKKADEAEKIFKAHKDYEKAKEMCLELMEKDSIFAKPFLLLGDAAFKKKEYKIMAQAYKGLISSCPDASDKAYYRLATYYYDTKQYDLSVPYYKAFLDFGSNDTMATDDATVKMFRANALTNPVDFTPQLLKGISTADPEYLPIISADNELCFFTRRFEYQSRNMLTSTSVEKFMISNFKNGLWELGEPLEYPFNKQAAGNEGGPSITIDNLHLYFTVNVKGNFDIYTSDFTPKGWTEPVSIGAPNDPKLWDSQPSIAPDNRTLYFASFRDSITQTCDIYKSVKKSGQWTSPVLLSAEINTAKNEKSPFIHPDGKTLYFSSDGLPGMGGYDIFMCKLDGKGNWGKPVNVGYPINTDADEVGFFVSTDGHTGYFSSNQFGSGGYDIYSFPLHEKARPEKVFLFKGQLKNDDNDVPDGARLEVKNITSKQVTQIDYDSLTGKYAGVLESNSEYILMVKKEGYAFNSKVLSVVDSASVKPMHIDFEIQKMKEGGSYNLNDILFAKQSFELNNVSKEVIKDFSEFLKSNPTVRVGIYGHTDNDGNAQDNLILSKNRAKAVYTYLISLGIDASRLSHDGFGQTKPLTPNNSTADKALNRRTEFVILKK